MKATTNADTSMAQPDVKAVMRSPRPLSTISALVDINVPTVPDEEESRYVMSCESSALINLSRKAALVRAAVDLKHRALEKPQKKQPMKM